MNGITIEPATKQDAEFISQAIIEAIGREHCTEIIGSHDKLDDLAAIFMELARADDTQYSYLNALRAGASAGHVAGGCI